MHPIGIGQLGNKLDGGNCIASKTEEEKTRVAADWYFLLPGHLTSDGNKLDGGRHNVIASKTILKFNKETEARVAASYDIGKQIY